MEAVKDIVLDCAVAHPDPTDLEHPGPTTGNTQTRICTRLRAFVGTDPMTGSLSQITRVVRAKTQRQAQKLLDKLRDQVTVVGPIGSTANVHTVAEKWAAHSNARIRVPTILREARRSAEAVIFPALGRDPGAGSERPAPRRALPPVGDRLGACPLLTEADWARIPRLTCLAF